MAALYEEFKMFVRPCSRNINSFLVPCGALIIFNGLQPEGDLDISFLR